MNRIDELYAIESIKRTKARFLRGIDTRDRHLLEGVLARDVEVDFTRATYDPLTEMSFPAKGVESVLIGAEAVLAVIWKPATLAVAIHHVSVPDIEVTSPISATAIWPMADRVYTPAGDVTSEMVGFGYYHESYIVEDGQWRIRSLRLLRTRLARTERPAG